MKLRRIMIIRDNELKIFEADDSTISRLTCIRGSLFKDDPRLTLVKDLPAHKRPTENVITDEIRQRGEDYAVQCRMLNQARECPPVRAVTPEPPRPALSFDEQLSHDWRFNPDIRKEFTNFECFRAFKMAEKAGRTRVYGRR